MNPSRNQLLWSTRTAHFVLMLFLFFFFCFLSRGFLGFTNYRFHFRVFFPFCSHFPHVFRVWVLKKMKNDNFHLNKRACPCMYVVVKFIAMWVSCWCKKKCRCSCRLLTRLKTRTPKKAKRNDEINPMCVDMCVFQIFKLKQISAFMCVYSCQCVY